MSLNNLIGFSINANPFCRLYKNEVINFKIQKKESHSNNKGENYEKKHISS